MFGLTKPPGLASKEVLGYVGNTRTIVVIALPTDMDGSQG